MGLALALGFARPALAQDAVDSIANPRSVGRAGTTTVSGDSGMAMLHNPGGMVRRSGKRLLLSASLRDTDTSYAAADAADSPVLLNRAAADMTPLIAYHQGNDAGTWVLGALVVGGQSEVSLPTPTLGQPKEDVTRLFPHRYGGTRWQRQWRRFAVGGALRIGESVGVGVSASLGQIQLRESRRVWAGFAGRDTLLDADRDLALQLGGEDLYNPGASAGVLVAPPEIPFEFALAFEFVRGQHFRRGPVALETTTNNAAPTADLVDASASLRLPSNYNLRSGLRYLGDRIYVEVGAEVYALRTDEARTWSHPGVTVIDQSGLRRSYASSPALVSQRSHMAVRTAVDYEALPGYLWVSTGYAYQSPSVSLNRNSPGFARLGGHTLALGLEAAYQDFTVSLGYAHHLQRSRSVSTEASAIPVVNPFAAGSAAANSGTYQQSSDQLGFAVELAWQ